MIKANGVFLARRDERWVPWDFKGYGEAVSLVSLESAFIRQVTPDAIIGTLCAGYEPIWHPSAS